MVMYVRVVDSSPGEPGWTLGAEGFVIMVAAGLWLFSHGYTAFEYIGGGVLAAVVYVVILSLVLTSVLFLPVALGLAGLWGYLGWILGGWVYGWLDASHMKTEFLQHLLVWQCAGAVLVGLIVLADKVRLRHE